MLKNLTFSKRFGVFALTVVAYIVANPSQIAALGIPPEWQTIIVAAAGFATKVYDTLTAKTA